MVSTELPIVAQVRVWDRLCILPVEDAGGVLEKDMVTTLVVYLTKLKLYLVCKV